VVEVGVVVVVEVEVEVEVGVGVVVEVEVVVGVEVVVVVVVEVEVVVGVGVVLINGEIWRGIGNSMSQSYKSNKKIRKVKKQLGKFCMENHVRDINKAPAEIRKRFMRWLPFMPFDGAGSLGDVILK
jgi:hypothetical protein